MCFLTFLRAPLHPFVADSLDAPPSDRPYHAIVILIAIPPDDSSPIIYPFIGVPWGKVALNSSPTPSMQ